jgi:glycosyltransferase involved in cell wall biosynthesis
MSGKHLIILGIRGIPAAHGGFETFAGYLSPWLRDRGWDVTVYCQGSESGQVHEDSWEGIRRIHIPVKRDGAVGTIEFDIKSTLHALRRPGTFLTLGYNTGFLSCLVRLRGRVNLINMDGLEWKRAKYSRAERAYLWLNERMAALSGTRLIADHPVIADHLASRANRAKIDMIPYGSPAIADADPAPLAALGLEPGRFLTLIARPEPENSILEIVRAFSRRPRGVKLALLGKYSKDHAYQAKVLAAASDEVIFTGAIYDAPSVSAVRVHCLAYLHGHQVGGTNPSLVEALGAGCPVVAHDNPFNRWVAADSGLYFANEDQCDEQLTGLLADPALRTTLSSAARRRWQEEFTWPMVLDTYTSVIAKAANVDGTATGS